MPAKKQFLALATSCLIVVAMACSSSKPSADVTRLTQGRWVVTELNGRSITPGGTPKDASLQFTADNKLSGSTGCNRLFGTYELAEANKIKFSGIGSTKMACPDMADENAFVNMLDETNGFSISGEELQLKKDQTLLARLKAESVK